MTRTQFYSCLKLIAAHQAGVQPLRAELIGAVVTLPLPKFSWTSSPTRPIDGRTTIEQMANGSDSIGNDSSSASTAKLSATAAAADLVASLRSPNATHLSAGSKSTASASVADRRESQTDTGNSDLLSTDSEVEHTDEAPAEAAAAAAATSITVAAMAMRNKEQQRHVARHHSAAGVNGSPEAWSTASDSPTPTNSVTERPWAQNPLWQGLFCEEQRQLLGTEEESSDRHSSDEDPATTTAASLTASNSTASVAVGCDADLETVFQITAEQRDYYLNQFRTVQPDVRGLVGGQAARVFFEKSRIPVDELRHIWQLCDVTRDGALSLAEFTAAMHLVVLRRNAIPLPPVLPLCLDPKRMHGLLLAEATGADERMPVIGGGGGVGGGASPSKSPMDGETAAGCRPPEADLLHLGDDGDVAVDGESTASADVMHSHRYDGSPVLGQMSTGSNTPPQSTIPLAAGTASHHPDSTAGSPRSTHTANAATALAKDLAAAATVAAASGGDWMNQSKEWTKFTESPTSNVSSPGPKPVNFDMQRTAQAVVSDPLILHPVPVRVTPIGGSTDGVRDDDVLLPCISGLSADAVDQSLSAGSGSPAAVNHAESYANATAATASGHRDSLLAGSGAGGELRAIQRPQPKKVLSNVGAIPPPPQRESSVGSAAAAMELCSAADQLTGQQVTAMAASFVDAMQLQQQQHSMGAAHFQAPPPPPPPPPRFVSNDAQ